jgi:hypothetical protein
MRALTRVAIAEERSASEDTAERIAARSAQLTAAWRVVTIMAPAWTASTVSLGTTATIIARKVVRWGVSALEACVEVLRKSDARLAGMVRTAITRVRRIVQNRKAASLMARVLPVRLAGGLISAMPLVHNTAWVVAATKTTATVTVA